MSKFFCDHCETHKEIPIENTHPREPIDPLYFISWCIDCIAEDIKLLQAENIIIRPTWSDSYRRAWHYGPTKATLKRIPKYKKRYRIIRLKCLAK